MSLEYWDKLKTPPKEALKKIVGGRLGGMTDIKPQWRFKAMTDVFGPCGIGWYYTVDNKETSQGDGANVCAFVDVSLYVLIDGEWSKPIPGTGGASFVAQEKNGVHTSDECFKMALTDALSVAMKALGVAADVYMGELSHDTKYSPPPQQKKESPHDTAKKNLMNAINGCKSVDELGGVYADFAEFIEKDMSNDERTKFDAFYKGKMEGMVNG